MYIRKIKWTFPNMESEDYILNDKITFSKGLWPGLMFSVEGLGLYKCERELFNRKRFEVTDTITFYFLKWLMTYHKNGTKGRYCNVEITENNIVYSGFALKHKIQNLIDKYINTPVNELLHKIQFKKQYNFELDRYWEGDYKFTSDMLSAFQLASNYEADLYLNGRLIFSPLGLEYKDNAKAVLKYLGRRFSNGKEYKLRGYKNTYDNRIKNYNRVQEVY